MYYEYLTTIKKYLLKIQPIFSTVLSTRASALMVLKLKKKKKITYFQVPDNGHQRSQYQLLAGLGLKHMLENRYILWKFKKEHYFIVPIVNFF